MIYITIRFYNYSNRFFITREMYYIQYKICKFYIGINAIN